MKRLLTVLLLCSTTSGFANAQSPQKYDALSNELEIMSGVLKTSLRQSAASNTYRVSQIEASYLAGQGAVFTFSVRGQSGNWVHEIETLVEGLVDSVPPVPPVPPLPPVNSVSELDDMVFETAHEWEAYAEETSHRFSQAFADKNSRLRDLRSMQRELAWEAREVERVLRDISFEMRHADEPRKKELLAKKEEFEKKLKQFETREGALKDELQAIEQEQAKQIEERKAKQQKAYNTFLAGFEAGLSDTLCRFGSGLRGLPESEHISMVLKDFEVDDNRKRKDRIYVFKRADIIRCVQEKIDANTLLTNANIYQF
ncbi:hypothetical protein [Alteromonas gracilis]|uniref:hypothetical protein n=1 Tax=Alteromonas gracilis TaxID=1479524 RepID=UPI0037367225